MKAHFENGLNPGVRFVCEPFGFDDARFADAIVREMLLTVEGEP